MLTTPAGRRGYRSPWRRWRKKWAGSTLTPSVWKIRYRSSAGRRWQLAGRFKKRMPRAPILPYESLAPSRSRWDAAFEAVLAALLLFMPFALGAVEAWSELVVTVAAMTL